MDERACADPPSMIGVPFTGTLGAWRRTIQPCVSFANKVLRAGVVWMRDRLLEEERGGCVAVGEQDEGDASVPTTHPPHPRPYGNAPARGAPKRPFRKRVCMMNCSSCGANLPIGAAVCPVCGTPTPYNVASSGSSSPYDSTVPASPYGGTPPPATAYGSPPYGTSPSLSSNPYQPLPSNPYEVAPNPYNPPPPLYSPPPPRRRSRVGLIIGIVALVFILSCVGIFGGLYVVGKNQLDAQATATTQATNLTATAAVSVYPFSNKLVLDDPLSDNSKGRQWDEQTNTTGGTCKFAGQSNFTFQVEMTITQGDAGGLLFRADSGSTKLYYLRLTESGGYRLFLYVDNSGTNARTLKQSSVPGFNKGLNQANLIGVVAKGDSLNLYINKQQFASITDSSYTSGQIGLAAESFSNSTEVVFTNLKIWSL